ncbi:hypothetical protein CDAR_489461 [Caerostris darwini]|uniref:Uncharacterized protein n=1 Tax=Caerostris darwini TaxID=1538125 RepID=A0AAV4U067_9ARAC|nr:hypothetical protein CDAR_489461 [Caerostris darwini]
MPKIQYVNDVMASKRKLCFNKFIVHPRCFQIGLYHWGEFRLGIKVEFLEKRLLTFELREMSGIFPTGCFTVNKKVLKGASLLTVFKGRKEDRNRIEIRIERDTDNCIVTREIHHRTPHTSEAYFATVLNEVETCSFPTFRFEKYSLCREIRDKSRIAIERWLLRWIPYEGGMERIVEATGKGWALEAAETVNEPRFSQMGLLHSSSFKILIFRRFAE